MIQFARSVTFPFRVEWETAPSGWTVNQTSSAGGNYTYTLTPTGAIPATTALDPEGTRPSADSSLNAIPMTEYFSGFADNSTVPWKRGDVVDGNYTVPTSRLLQYQPTYPAPSTCASEVVTISDQNSITFEIAESGSAPLPD